MREVEEEWKGMGRGKERQTEEWVGDSMTSDLQLYCSRVSQRRFLFLIF